MKKRAEKIYRRLLCLTVILSLSAAAMLQIEGGQPKEKRIQEQIVCWWCLLNPSFGFSDLLRKVPVEKEKPEENPQELLEILRQAGKIRFCFHFWKG